MNAKKMLAALGLGALVGVAYHAVRRRVWPRVKDEIKLFREALDELCEYPYGDVDIEDVPEPTMAGDDAADLLQDDPAKVSAVVTVPYEEGEEPTTAKTLAKFLGISEKLARQIIKTGGIVKVVAEDVAKEERSEKLVASPEDANATKSVWESEEDEYLSPSLGE